MSVVAAAGLTLPAPGCRPEPSASDAAATSMPVAASPTAAPTPDLFTTSVRPMLVKKCAPCHEPGGKLYEKLPFDDAHVVAAHALGMMKRLQGDDRAVLEQWIATLPGREAP